MQRVLKIVRLEEARQALQLTSWRHCARQIGFSACAAPDEKCDNLFCAPKLVRNLLNGNKLRIVVKRPEDGKSAKGLPTPCGSSSRRTTKEAQYLWESQRVSEVQMGATDRASEVLFGNVPSACVVEGDEELTQVDMTVERNSSSQTQRESKQTNVDHLLDKTIGLQCVKPCISAVHGEVAKVSRRAGERVAVDTNWQRVDRKSDDSLPISKCRSRESKETSTRGNSSLCVGQGPAARPAIFVERRETLEKSTSR